MRLPDPHVRAEAHGLRRDVAGQQAGRAEAGARSPGFDGITFATDAYAVASRSVEQLLRQSGRTNGAVIVPHRNHLVALSLARAGIIEYRAVLGADRRASYNGYAVIFESIVNRTAKALRRNIEKR